MCSTLYSRSSNHLLCVVSVFLCTIFDLNIVDVIGSSPTNPTSSRKPWLIKVSGIFVLFKKSAENTLKSECMLFFPTFWPTGISCKLWYIKVWAAFSSLLFPLLYQNQKCIKIHSSFSSFVDLLWRKVKFRSSSYQRRELFLYSARFSKHSFHRRHCRRIRRDIVQKLTMPPTFLLWVIESLCAWPCRKISYFTTALTITGKNRKPISIGFLL